MDQAALEDAILRHLQEVAVCKKALLQVSLEIVGEYPSQAALTLRVLPMGFEARPPRTKMGCSCL